MKIGVTGGSGFIGSHLVENLAKSDNKIRVLTHQVTKVSVESNKIDLCQGNIEDFESLKIFCRDLDVVIHLVGIIAETRSKTFKKTVTEGTSLLVKACLESDVKKIIYISALGATGDSESKYFQSKYIAEQAIINSGIDYFILRPSVIYGRGDGFVNLLIGLLKIPLITPVIGTGRYLMQPVYIDDLITSISKSIYMNDIKNIIIDIAGPEKLEYLQILDILKKRLKKRRINFHLPISLMKFFAVLLEKVIKPAPFTKDQLIMMEMGSCGNIIKMMELYLINPIKFSNGIKKYL